MMEQRENEMPFIQFPLLGNTDVIVKITPHMYYIEENVVRDNIIRNKNCGPLPEKELNDYSTNEKRIKHFQNFSNNPLYYLATDNKMIYGISTDKIKKIYEEQIKQINEEEEEQDNDSDDEQDNNNNNNNHKIKKPKLTANSISNTLNSILIILKKIYEREFTLDEVFPKTKIERNKAKADTDTYHKSNIRSEMIRVIPIYVFPYLIKTRTFNKIPKLAEDIERFIDRLKRYIDANSMNSVKYYEDSLFQLKANLTQSIRDIDLTANELKLDIIEYQKNYSNIVEKNTILKRKSTSLEKKVASLEKDVKKIKVDNKKTRKNIKKK